MVDPRFEVSPAMSEKHGDQHWMQLAIDLARNGLGLVEPNPMVGCVLVKENQVVGQGWHRRFGSPHAEVEAINNAESDPTGATLYVNLEPCCHHGKTPPCTDLLIKTGIRRVVVGSADPFPKVSGKGIKQLTASGIEVECGTLEQQCRRLNASFFKLCETGRPWVIAKWAMTLDGKMATRTGDSKWISSERSREFVHQLRSRVDGIVVGSGTTLADDPMLNARLGEGVQIPRVATRIIVDSKCRIGTMCNLAKTAREFPTLIATSETADESAVKAMIDAGCKVWKSGFKGETAKVDLEGLLDELGRRSFSNVLVEGGSALLGAMFDLNLIDEVHVFVAPIVAGGSKAISPVGGLGNETISLASRLCDVSIQQLESDVYIRGRVR